MMNILLWKEFKENFKYALGAFLIFTCLFFYDNGMNMSGLRFGSFPTSCWLYYQLLGAIFGLAQSFPELKRDRWSFLCHRPQSMNMIYFSKIIVGLTYYLIISITIFYLIGLNYANARIRYAPFFWKDLWAYVVFIIVGVMTYFAAFLCGIRQRKWYGTRFFPLIFTFMASFYFLTISEGYPSQSPILTIPLALIGTMLLGMTCWCYFTRSLEEIRKSLFARVVNVITMYLISVPIQVFIFVFLLTLSAAILPRPQISQSYVYDLEGTTYRIQTNRELKKMISIKNLDQPEKQLNVANFVSDESFTQIKNQMYKHQVTITGEPGYFSSLYAPSYTFGPYKRLSYKELFYNSPDDYWFYVFDEDRILGYSMYGSREPVSIDCDFDQLIVSGESNHDYGSNNPRLLTTRTDGFYLFNTKKRSVNPLTNPKIEKPIRTMAISLKKHSKRTVIMHENEIALYDALPRVMKEDGSLVEPKLAPEEMASWSDKDDPRYYHQDGYYPMNTVYLPGEELARIPFTPDLPDNSSVGIAQVSNDNRYLVSVSHHSWQDLFWPGHPIQTLLELDDQGNISKQRHLEYYTSYGLKPSDKLAIYTITLPVAPLLGVLAYDSATRSESDEFYGSSFSSRFNRDPKTARIFIASIFASCLIASGVTYWIGKRNSFTRKELVQWMIFNFLLGWGGVLTMVACRHWTRLTTCASCGRKRLQTNDKCEHCGAEFPLPEPDGTEIFSDPRKFHVLEEVTSSAS